MDGAKRIRRKRDSPYTRKETQMATAKKQIVVAVKNAVCENYLPSQVQAMLLDHCAAVDVQRTKSNTVAVALYDLGIRVEHLREKSETRDVNKIASVHRVLCMYIVTKNGTKDAEAGAEKMLSIITASSSDVPKEERAARNAMIQEVNNYKAPLLVAMRKYEAEMDKQLSGVGNKKDKARAWAMNYLSKGRTMLATKSASWFDIDAGDALDIFETAKLEIKNLETIK